MSDGSSLDQVSECRSETFSAASRTDSISIGSSDSSTVAGITVLGRSNQPINLRTTKRPPSEKIAKDTGCCLYSAITFIVVMVVTLGIVLIIAGPVLGLSLFPPLLRNQPSALIDHSSTWQSFNQSSINASNDTDYDQQSSHAEYYDYEDTHNETDYYYSEKLVMDFNSTDTNETEDLSKLTPEALRLHPKYVAYVPIPVNDDDEDEDGALLHEIDHDRSLYEEDEGTGSLGSKDVVKEKVLLPIVMVPSGTSHTHEVSVSPDDDDAWKNDGPGGRYEDEVDESSETLLPSSSRRVPNRNEERLSSGSRIDYQMFGSLAPRNRLRNRNRNDKKKLYTYLRAPARHPNVNKRIEGIRYPPRYIRPPPIRPRNRNQQARFQTPAWSVREPDRPRAVLQPTPSPKKPVYSYPKDAMSIQDIINYMTSLGTPNEEPARANPVHSNQLSAVNRAVWNPEPPPQPQQPYRPRDRPSIIPPSYIADSKQLQVGGNRPSPYSFKLDVYPVKDGGRNDGTSSNNRGVTVPYPEFNPYQNHPRFRQNQENRRPPPASRQRPYDTNRDIDYSYKIRYQDQRQRPETNQGFRRPPSSFREQYQDNYEEYSRPVNSRPRPVQSSRDQVNPEKPKVVVHLNVYNQKNQGTHDNYDRNGDEIDEQEETEEDEDYFYSPSDIYRAVLRNNAVRRNKNLKGDDKPQSRSFDEQATYSSDSTHQDNLYRNHNMAVTDHYYRSLSSSKNSSRYRSSSSNSHSNHDDDDPEPLPNPMPLDDDASSTDPATEAPPTEWTESQPHS